MRRMSEPLCATAAENAHAYPTTIFDFEFLPPA